MIRKEVNYDVAIDEWRQLLDSGTLSSDQASLANAQLAGLRAEKEMAYYLDVHFGGSQQLAVFNNLKIEHRGLIAQIDHLVLTRWSAYFIETKSVGGAININADGQWARVYGKRYKNMESPIEQSRRHEALLVELMEARISEFMGKLMGMQKYFYKILDVHHLIAVSTGAKIQGRGKKAVSDHIRPLDQVPRTIEEEHRSVRSGFLETGLCKVLRLQPDRHEPAFSKKEFVACQELLLSADISQTPLEQAHEFIASLPDQAGELEAVAEPAAASPEEEQTTPAQDTPPDCPTCGERMVLRTARRGKRAGKKFFGCPKYPTCKGIVNV